MSQSTIEVLARVFATTQSRNAALRRLVKNNAFKTRCSNTHGFLTKMVDQLNTRGTLSDAQSAVVYREMSKYIPLVMTWSVASEQQVREMNLDREIAQTDTDAAEAAESLRHAENDGAE